MGGFLLNGVEQDFRNTVGPRFRVNSIPFNETTSPVLGCTRVSVWLVAGGWWQQQPTHIAQRSKVRRNRNLVHKSVIFDIRIVLPSINSDVYAQVDNIRVIIVR